MNVVILDIKNELFPTFCNHVYIDIFLHKFVHILLSIKFITNINLLTKVTTFIKTKFKISDTNIRLAVNITEYQN